MPDPQIIIYTDGACAGNQHRENKGGWGAILSYGNKRKELWGGERDTTNNRMELTACIRALQELKGSGQKVELYSDSAYIVNCFKDRWYVNWQRNGWKNAKKQPVENRDLWEALLEAAGRHQVSFKKVKGHAGVELNERADELANRGMEELV